jgi:tubulin beta
MDSQITGKGGSASTFAAGYYRQECINVSINTMDALRREAEEC